MGGLGEVLAGALDHRGDCRAGGSGAEDTDIDGVVQHEGAISPPKAAFCQVELRGFEFLAEATKMPVDLR